MTANEEINKAIEDIQTGKVEEQVIWEKGKTLANDDIYDVNSLYPEKVSIEEAPLTGALDIVTQYRDHEEDHDNCWCNKKYPLFVHGHEVGVAVPLATGDYSLQFDDSNAGRLVQTLLDLGTMNNFSIQDDKGILDLGEDD